jgi:branched-chain amino acid aminotransferase
LPILINNKFVLQKNATIPITSEILRGYGIFETLRTYKDKKILHAKDHLNRLFTSAKKIDLEIKYNQKEILQMLKKITQKSPHQKQRIKIIAIPKKIIILSNKLKNKKAIYQGVKCLSIICERALPEIKSISYLPSLISHQKAEQKGCFDAILLNEKGEVYEGSYSNLFWFEKNVLCTRKDKILPGITRKIILKISPFKIKFKIIKINDLYEKKEIFITSSTKGIVPVIQIDHKKIGNGLPGRNTKKLIQEFLNYLP